MKTLNNFASIKLKSISVIKGGKGETGGGSYRKGGHAFDYDSDYTNWEEGSDSYSIWYYGIRTCTC